MSADRFDALVAALCLAVLAPTDEQSAKAVRLAEELATGFPEERVREAKIAAQELVL